jgi:hypothetical protein
MSGQVFVSLGMVIGNTALAMSFKTSIGGVNETVATTLFAVVFLFDLVKAFVHIRPREDCPASGVDDPRLRHRAGRGDHPADRGRVLCHQPSHAPDPARILRHGVLAGIHATSHRRGGMDQLHSWGELAAIV